MQTYSKISNDLVDSSLKLPDSLSLSKNSSNFMVFFGNLFVGNDISGHFLPRDCGCTLLKETNDFSRLGDLINMAKNGITKNALYTSVNQFNGDAIFLIRNPFEAIISYRNNVHHDAESFLSDKSLAKIEGSDLENGLQLFNLILYLQIEFFFFFF